jgi:hypothetical protein
MATKKTKESIDLGTLEPEYGLTIEELRRDLEHGVVPDDLNYRKLFPLFFAGIMLVVALAYGAIQMYRWLDFQSSQNAAISATYPVINNLKQQHKADLTSTGVVDADNQVYRIPVDSAITLILNEQTR